MDRDEVLAQINKYAGPGKRLRASSAHRLHFAFRASDYFDLDYRHWFYLQQAKGGQFALLIYPKPDKSIASDHFLVIPASDLERSIDRSPICKERAGKNDVSEPGWKWRVHLDRDSPEMVLTPRGKTPLPIADFMDRIDLFEKWIWPHWSSLDESVNRKVFEPNWKTCPKCNEVSFPDYADRDSDAQCKNKECRLWFCGPGQDEKLRGYRIFDRALNDWMHWEPGYHDAIAPKSEVSASPLVRRESTPVLTDISEDSLTGVDTLADLWFERFENDPQNCPSVHEMFPNVEGRVLDELKKKASAVRGGGKDFIPNNSGAATSDKNELWERLRPGYQPDPDSSEVLERELGRGGFGSVWLSRDPKTDTCSVRKFSIEQLGKTGVLSLRNEIAKLQRLDHPGVVQVREDKLDAEIPHIQFEHVEGESLDKVLERYFETFGPLKPAVARSLIGRIAEVLAYLHGRPTPIVHRDLKPENIIVTNSIDFELMELMGGEPSLQFAELKLVDFGLASSMRSHQDRTSAKNSLGPQFNGWGSRAYMPPQQRMGDPADPSDDVYALGVLWHDMLIGKTHQGSPTGITWKTRLERSGATEQDTGNIERCIESDRGPRPTIEQLTESLGDTLRTTFSDDFEFCLIVSADDTSPEDANVDRDDDCDMQVRNSAEAVFELWDRRWHFSEISGQFESKYIERLLEVDWLIAYENKIESLNSIDCNLQLNNIVTISTKLALALGRYINRVCLGGCWLGLGGLASISLPVAKAFVEAGEEYDPGENQWEVILNGVRTLEADVAVELVSRFVGIDLSGLKEIDSDLASILAHTKKDVQLDGLQHMSSDVLRVLLSNKKLEVGLKGLELTMNVLETLATIQHPKVVLCDRDSWPDHLVQASGAEDAPKPEKIRSDIMEWLKIIFPFSDDHGGDDEIEDADDIELERLAEPEHPIIDVLSTAAEHGNVWFFDHFHLWHLIGTLDSSLCDTPFTVAVKSRQFEFLDAAARKVSVKELTAALDFSVADFVATITKDLADRGFSYGGFGRTIGKPLIYAMERKDELLVRALFRVQDVLDQRKD